MILCITTAGNPDHVAGTLVGLMYVNSFRTGHAFNADNLASLMTFSAYSAVAPSIAWAAGNVVGYKKV